ARKPWEPSAHRRKGVRSERASALAGGEYGILRTSRAEGRRLQGGPSTCPGRTGGLRVARHASSVATLRFYIDSHAMSESASAAVAASAITEQAAIARSESFTRERFVHDGEDIAVALA